jgi:hypothetical protein
VALETFAPRQPAHIAPRPRPWLTILQPCCPKGLVVTSVKAFLKLARLLIVTAGFFVDRYQGWLETAWSPLGDRRVSELIAAGRGLRVADAVGIAHQKMEALRPSTRLTVSK